MKLFILGATGATGRELLDRALSAGHDVTVLVRKPASLAVAHPRLTVVTGDATDAEALAAVLPGQDAVLSALGAGNDTKSDIASRAATALVAAAQTTGVRRIIVLSAFGVGDSLTDASRVQKLLYKTVMKPLYADKAVADSTYRNSGLDYTLVYPVALSNGAATGHYQADQHPNVKGMPRIARADVAAFMLDEAIASRWVRATAVLTAA